MHIFNVIMPSWAMSLLNSLRWWLWKNLGNEFYNHIHGYTCVITFLHFLIHTAWSWLLYGA